MVRTMKVEGVSSEEGGGGGVICEVMTGDRRQRLYVVRGDCAGAGSGEEVLVLSEGDVRLRSWPLQAARLMPDQPNGAGGLTLEVGGETLQWSRVDANAARALAAAATRAAASVGIGESAPLSEAALAALLHDAAPLDGDAEAWVRRLGDRVARLDALNVQGMLAAATEGGGARLAGRLDAAAECGALLATRLRRLDVLVRGAGESMHAGSGAGAARSDASARALLAELEELWRWLEPAPLRDLDSLSEVSLTTTDGRARALEAARALRAVLRGERACPPHRRRLAAVRERLRRLGRTRDTLAAAVSRHLNNLLIHLGNEAGGSGGVSGASGAGSTRHHAELVAYAPFMLWLKEMDEKAFEALARLYVATWSRVHERDVRAHCDAARAALATSHDAAAVATANAADDDRVDELFDSVLTLVENLCNSEQEFCSQFFHLDADVKSDADGDGDNSEKSDRSDSGVDGGGASRRTGVAGAESRRMFAELFPALEPELVALVANIDHHDQYGAMRALACVGRRVLSEGAAGHGGGGRWACGALAAAAVAAKRGADRSIAARIDALPLAVKQAARRPKCGVLGFVGAFEELSSACERIFSVGRRADVERWYLALAEGMVRCIASAEHPRTPRAVLHMENYHRVAGALAALRLPALDSPRQDARRRYNDALRTYVTQYFGRPLEKLTQFFEGVSEAVASGVREDEVCYRAAFSKHELKRLLALYPAHEVRKSLHRLYRTVEKHLSEEGGLLQVVWRAMQEEFLAQHRALQARLAACYAGAGLALPLTTQDILDAFSDIARHH